MSKVGQIIKEKRLNLHMTTKEVAAKVGVSDATISRWENGEINSMRLPLAYKLSQALHSSIFDFIPEYDGVSGKIKIPIVGRVACGMPIFCEQNIEGELYIEAKEAWGKVFGLKVVGKSMEPKIEEGDWVIIRIQPDVDDGDIAVVMIDGDEGTCKQIHKTKDGIMLTAFNQDVFPPKFFSNEEIEQLPVRIVGKVIEVRRKM